MNYEQKYKEALERAREELRVCGSQNCDAARQIFRLFPELKESEDEKIRKDCMKYLDWEYQHCSFNEDKMKIEKCIAWLEKQAEKNTHYTDIKEKAHQIAWETSKDYDPSLSKEAWCEMAALDMASWLVKQDEKKFNFKVGQWIVATGKCVYLIAKIDGFDVTLVDTNGDEYVFDASSLEDAYKWTIADAKEGDVLVCNGDIKYSNGIKYERICLFKNFDSAFFTLTKTSNYVEEYGIDVNIDYPDNTVPATKEQKEILFMAMKHAGYKWDVGSGNGSFTEL